MAAPAAPTEPEISLETASDQPGSNESDQPGTAALDHPSGYTLKVTTRLVDVSLVADDKKGHPVNGLKAEDIEVFDNGRRQEIKFFSSVESVSPDPGNTPTASPEVTFSNRSVDAAAGSPPNTTTQAGATILLIDESHIAWSDLNNARTQMLQFLASAPLDERIGLYTMNSFGFRVLAEVTTDHVAVSARLQKWMPTAQSVAQAQRRDTQPPAVQ